MDITFAMLNSAELNINALQEQLIMHSTNGYNTLSFYEKLQYLTYERMLCALAYTFIHNDELIYNDEVERAVLKYM